MEDPERTRAAASAANTTPADDDASVVVLGSGILGRTPYERHTGRYGAVHLTVVDSVPGEPGPASTVQVPPDEDLRARILRDLAKADASYEAAAATASAAAGRRPDVRVVAFDHAPLGAAGTLVAHVIHSNATASDREFGKRNPELRPPEPGERVVLGSGTLFTETYGEAPVIGVRPDDGRAENWMDSDAIFRCKGHLVRLEFEMPADGTPGAGPARRVQTASPEEALARPAGRTAQLGFPAASPLALPAAAGPAAGAGHARLNRTRPAVASRPGNRAP